MNTKNQPDWAELGRRFQKFGDQVATQSAAAAAEMFGELAKGLQHLETQFNDWSERHQKEEKEHKE